MEHMKYESTDHLIDRIYRSHDYEKVDDKKFDDVKASKK